MAIALFVLIDLAACFAIVFWLMPSDAARQHQDKRSW